MIDDRECRTTWTECDKLDSCRGEDEGAPKDITHHKFYYARQ